MGNNQKFMHKVADTWVHCGTSVQLELHIYTAKKAQVV